MGNRKSKKINIFGLSKVLSSIHSKNVLLTFVISVLTNVWCIFNCKPHTFFLVTKYYSKTLTCSALKQLELRISEQQQCNQKSSPTDSAFFPSVRKLLLFSLLVTKKIHFERSHIHIFLTKRKKFEPKIWTPLSKVDTKKCLRSSQR